MLPSLLLMISPRASRQICYGRPMYDDNVPRRAHGSAASTAAPVHAPADFEARMATSSMRNLSCSNERERFGSTASACVGRNFAMESAKSWRRQRRVKLVVWRGTCAGGSSIVHSSDLTRLLEITTNVRRNARLMLLKL